MNNQFDELAKSMAQSVTRRAALKKFGVGLAGMALACFGLANIARADKVKTTPCSTNTDCTSGQVCCNGVCVAGIPDWCDRSLNYCCCYCAGKKGGQYPTTALPECDERYGYCKGICGAMLGCSGFIGP